MPADDLPGLVQHDVVSNYENNRAKYENYINKHENMDSYS